MEGSSVTTLTICARIDDAVSVSLFDGTDHAHFDSALLVECRFTELALSKSKHSEVLLSWQ